MLLILGQIFACSCPKLFEIAVAAEVAQHCIHLVIAFDVFAVTQDCAQNFLDSQLDKFFAQVTIS